jgi:hypothetical protein
MVLGIELGLISPKLSDAMTQICKSSSSDRNYALSTYSKHDFYQVLVATLATNTRLQTRLYSLVKLLLRVITTRLLVDKISR